MSGLPDVRGMRCPPAVGATTTIAGPSAESPTVGTTATTTGSSAVGAAITTAGSPAKSPPVGATATTAGPSAESSPVGATATKFALEIRAWQLCYDKERQGVLPSGRAP